MTRHPFDLKGKVAIVTGSGRGLGKAAALGLGTAGARVVTNARTSETCATTAEEIAAAGGEAVSCPADITERDACDTIVSTALETFGKLDILVCNAASNLHGPAATLSPDWWRKCLEIEATGYFFMCQAASGPMIGQESGSIVFISANSSVVGYSELVTVATAKVLPSINWRATWPSSGATRTSASTPSIPATPNTCPQAATSTRANRRISRPKLDG